MAKECNHPRKMWGYMPKMTSPSISYTREAYFCTTCGEIFKTRSATEIGIRKEELEQELQYKKVLSGVFGKKEGNGELEAI